MQDIESSEVGKNSPIKASLPSVHIIGKSMNKDSIFYPHSLMYLVKLYVRSTLENKTWATDWLVLILCLIPIPLIIWYYILDVLDNVFDKFTMWLFVDLQLWAIQQQTLRDKTS